MSESGTMMRSTDECEMSRSCHSATSSSAACRLPRSTRREAAQLLRLDRVALVRHRARTLLLALAERLFRLAHLGALQMADLERERLDARSDRRARVQHLGVTVAREHLGRGHRLQPEVLAHVALDRRIDVRVRADRARELADRDRAPGPAPAVRDRGEPACAQSASLAPNVVGSAWMPCVRPTIGVSRNSRARLAIGVLELGRGAGDQVERPRHLQRERGVDDVARRQAVVHPRPGRRADVFLHDVDERGDVVVGDPLALVDRGDVEAGALRARLARRRRERRRAGPTPRPRAPRPRATRRSAPRR